MIYLIGSLRNMEVPIIGKYISDNTGIEVFDEWWSVGDDADEWWHKHENYKGKTYKEAIYGYHARHVFEFDKTHLDRACAGILLHPAGKSAHLELGYLTGQNKRGYILYDKEPDRFDIMTLFATGGIFFSKEELLKQLQEDKKNGLIR